MDVVTYVLCKKLVASAITGISDISLDGSVMTITTSNGQTFSLTFPAPADGVSITNVEIDENEHLIITLSDNSTIDVGELPGAGVEGLLQYRTKKSFPKEGKEGTLYLALDTEKIYYWDEGSKLYRTVTTNGTKDELLTSVELKGSVIEFDGAATTFNTPVDDMNISVYINGIYCTEGVDYTINRTVQPNTITFNEVYEPTDLCRINWVKGKIYEDPFVYATDEDINNLFVEEENK